MNTCYSELGLTPECTDAEVKAAWRRLAARWHPDRNGSPQALRKIQRINRALEEIRRARRQEPDPPSPAPGAADDGHEQPARTLDVAVALTLEEALAGCVRTVQWEAVDACAACAATGTQCVAGGCPACEGRGKLRQHLWFGWLPAEVECGSCQGSGVCSAPCEVCHGAAAMTRTHGCRVSIPAGVHDGDTLHVHADSSRGEPQDALAVHVELLPHEFFRLEDDGTLRCELPVDGYAWIANRWIDVPTLTGLQQMRLRRGHLAYRMKGLGFPARHSGRRGDCLVTVVPLFPDELNAGQERQIDRLVASNTGCSGTSAGGRMSGWHSDLERWQARLAQPAS